MPKSGASPALIALLSTGQFVPWDLYTFTLVTGETIRLCAGDFDVLYGGNTFSARGPFIDQQNTKATGHWKAGLDIDTWQIAIMPRPFDLVTRAANPDKIGTQPWLAAVRGGALDGAAVRVDRAYWSQLPTFPTWTAPWASPLIPTEVLTQLFVGRVAAVDIKDTRAILQVNSLMEVLTGPMPRNLYQSGCPHTLFDAGCQLVAASFAVNGTVAGVTSNGVFASNLSQTDDYFSLGRLVWLTGNNAGFSRLVRSYAQSSGAITLIAPMPFAVQVGDTFTVYPGCDKQLTTCTNKFSNAANFGGVPYTPVPETAI